jgi:quinol monooxygenase YgiN
MGEIAVYAKLVAKPNRREELLHALEPLMRSAIETEPGTEVYAVHLDPENADAIWFYEIFTDDAAQAAHRANEEKAHDVGALVQDLLAAPVDVTWGRVHRFVNKT